MRLRPDRAGLEDFSHENSVFSGYQHTVYFDEHGEICALTIEHANARADVPHFSFEQIGSERRGNA
jgi:hypothetical protein